MPFACSRPTKSFASAGPRRQRWPSLKEVDYYWEKLSQGGDPQAQVCGWLKDKYGLSWQVVPEAVTELVGDPSSEKSQRAMSALLQMKKIDLAALERAYEGMAREA
jgi:predicted 3-demethylubiquinone-9 3-methyltransferase (glyoxalase superfamily)